MSKIERLRKTRDEVVRELDKAEESRIALLKHLKALERMIREAEGR